MVARYATATRRELAELDERLAQMSDAVIDLADGEQIVIDTAYESL